jgi:hypothetical protein
MLTLLALFPLLCLVVALLAIVVLWPRHRFWLLPLLILPWLGLVMITPGPYRSGLGILPVMLAILLPLMAVVIDRWKSLRRRAGFWIGVTIGVALIGFAVWSGAAGELGLNHDGEYCSEPGSSLADCPLDPLKVINVYLTMLGYVVIAVGPVPSLLLFGWIGYRRWFGTVKS